MTIFYVLIFVFIAVLVGLGLVSLIRYRRDSRPEDVRTFQVLSVVAVLLLAMNLAVIRPTTTYDSVRVEIELYVPGTYILPFPNEPGLVGEMEFAYGQGDFALVETDMGKGLNVQCADRVILKGSIVKHDGTVDYSVDLQDDDCFWVYYQSDEMNHTFRELDLRIVHQSPDDFHSNQLTFAKPGITNGWNLLKFEHYTDDFLFTSPSDL